MLTSSVSKLLITTITGAVVCFGQAAIGVGNYSGLTGAQPLAPGSIASVYGTFTGVALTSAATLNPMPREIAGVRVRIAGQDAPLYFVSAGQINFVVPVTAPQGRQTIEVVSGGNVVGQGTVLVWDFGPGLAVSNSAPNSMQGIIQNQDYAVNSEAARARRGEVISIYATGCGQTNSGLRDGAPPTELSFTRGAVQVFMAGERADVQFAGAHPQFPGICQINAVVPNRGFLTGQVPLYFTINGLPSNQVLFWVQ